MTSRKLILLVLAIVLVLGSLPLAAQDEEINMTMWVRSIPFQTQALVDEWNANNDSQIELTVIPSAEFVTKMGAAIAAGEPPDIASIDLIYTPAFAAAGQLVDITDFVKELPYADTLTPAHMALGMYEGRNYAVPTGVDGSFIVYNIDLFEQAGLDADNPPTTWDEMLDAMRAIDALGDEVYGYWFSMNCAGCNAFTFLPFIWASGGDVLSDDYSEATIDSDPIVRDALAFYNTIWEEGLVPEGASIDNGSNFVSAFTAAILAWPAWATLPSRSSRTTIPDLNFGVFHIPGKDGGAASFGGGDVIAIASGSRACQKKPGAFIEWTMSDEAQIEIYAANGQIPVRLGLVDNKYFEGDERQMPPPPAPWLWAIRHTPPSTTTSSTTPMVLGWRCCKSQSWTGTLTARMELGQERFTQIMEG